ncbi:UNVERIFIED_CONTAM: zinc finger protein [Trichonephila clavipes]
MFNSKRYLKRRELVHRHKNSVICEICKAVFKEFSSLKIHLLTHTKKKPYSCFECNKSYSRRHNLNLHLQPTYVSIQERSLMCRFTVKREKKSLTCEENHQLLFYRNQSFITDKSLHRHLRAHTEENVHICENCKKTIGYCVYVETR